MLWTWLYRHTLDGSDHSWLMASRMVNDLHNLWTDPNIVNTQIWLVILGIRIKREVSEKERTTVISYKTNFLIEMTKVICLSYLGLYTLIIAWIWRYWFINTIFIMYISCTNLAQKLLHLFGLPVIFWYTPYFEIDD